MRKIFMFFCSIVLLSSVCFPQSLPDSFYVEYRNETAGDYTDTIKLSKRDKMFKLFRTGKHGSFMTLIDYGANEYCDFGIDKGVTGSRYGKINYDIICAMWRICFNGMTPLIKQYVKLPDKQTVMGKECNVYDSGKLSVMNSTMQYFFFGDLMLKQEKPGHVIEAVVFDENPVFGEKEFDIPDNVQWLYDYRKGK
jgi:hypothetical protein